MNGEEKNTYILTYMYFKTIYNFGYAVSVAKDIKPEMKQWLGTTHLECAIITNYYLL